MKNLYNKIRKLNPRNKNLTLTVVTGSLAGAKALLSDGEIQALWESCIDTAGGFGPWLEKNLSVFFDLSGAGLMEVDGQSIYYEQLAGKKKLVICGAGHVGLAVTRLGKLMDYHVTVLDDRPELKDKADKAGADLVMIGPYVSGLKSLAGDPDTCFVIVTRGHYDDMESLKTILEKEYAYIGLMGSRTKTTAYKESLKEQGYTDELISLIHMPVGLKIGAQTPEEIAVSIMAEIIQVCNGGEKRFGYQEDLLAALCERMEPMVLATVIRKEGSGPRDVGSRMLVFPDGSFLGTVGGGIVEAKALKAAGQMLMDMIVPKPHIVTVELGGKLTDKDQMICGGRMEVLLEMIAG